MKILPNWAYAKVVWLVNAEAGGELGVYYWLKDQRFFNEPRVFEPLARPLLAIADMINPMMNIGTYKDKCGV